MGRVRTGSDGRGGAKFLRVSRLAAVFILSAAAGLGACADAPTAFDVRAELVSSTRSHALGEAGTVEVFCSAGQVVSGREQPYTFLRLTIKLPASTRAPDGRTVLYRYRGHADGRVVAAANCRIPHTPGAVAHMDRVFGVKERGGRHERTLSEATVTIEGLVVNTCQYGGQYPACWPQPMPEYESSSAPKDESICYFECGGGSDSGGAVDPEIDAAIRPECERDAQGNCITRDLSPEEWRRFIARVALIKEDPPECAGAKQILRDLIAAGPAARRIRFWDGIDYQGKDPETGDVQQRYGQNLSDAQGRYLEYDSHWVWGDSTLIVHEGLHYYLHVNNIPIYGADNETWVSDRARVCSGARSPF